MPTMVSQAIPTGNHGKLKAYFYQIHVENVINMHTQAGSTLALK